MGSNKYLIINCKVPKGVSTASKNPKVIGHVYSILVQLLALWIFDQNS